MVVRGSVFRQNAMLVFVRVRARAVRTSSVSSCHGFVGQAQRIFAELRRKNNVSLCVLARQSACACEATPEIARALLSRHSVALRIQWLSAPTMLALEADVRRALARSGFYTAEFVEKHSHNITVALSSAGILGDRGHASVTAAALTIPGVPSALPTLRFPSSSCPCCAALLSPRPDKARVSRVLHTTGWAAYNHVPVRCRNVSQCVLANKYVWYNYVTDCEHLHRWTWPQDEELQFFFLSNAWGVTTAWLRQMSQRLAHHYASFTGEAAVHDFEARRAGQSTPDEAKTKLFHAWLLWRYVIRAHERSDGSTGGDELPEINLLEAPEALLARSLQWYLPHMLRRRVRHARDSNFSCQAVVMDGNCKLSRRICGRDVAEVRHHCGLQQQIVVRCACKPTLSQKCCARHTAAVAPEHQDCEMIEAHRLSREQLPVETPEPYEVRLVDRRFAEDPKYQRRWVLARCVPTATLMEYWGKQGARAGHQACVSSSAGKDLAAVSCNTHKELKAARGRAARSAGWLFASTPDGFVVHLAEFVGAESLGQRYFFLADLLEAAPEIDIVIHDDACHLRKYAASRAGKSPLARRLAYPQVKYVIDRFHSKGHVDHWCKQHCMHTSPENEKALQGVNTSVCEQQFSKLGRYKFMVSKMGAAIGAFFLNEVVELRNKERARHAPSK